MSSFAYLKYLPVDYLKIAGVFIEDMVNDAMDHAIVDAINRISHILGLHTVAESVEDMVTLERLKALDVDYVQGYFIAKPEALLAERDDGGLAPISSQQIAPVRSAAAGALQRSGAG
jgi:Amt family ammonium transporter